MSRLIRAARFHGFGTEIKVEQIPYPDPGPGEVTVRLVSCGVCGSDVHFIEGMPVPGGVPITLGHEPAGFVETLGPGVEDWKKGDRVALHLGAGCHKCRVCLAGHANCCPQMIVPGLHIDGGFAEVIRVSAQTLVRIPAGVTMAAAGVATDCVATPYHALKCRAGLRPGERVAVIGCGGLGVQAVALARVLGAERIIALDVSAVALERAARAGANECIDTKKHEASEAIRAATDGADVVIECVGHQETIAAGARALRPGGRLVAVGVGMMPPAIDIPQAIFSYQELSVLGSFGSHRADLEEVLRLEAAGSIDIEGSISHRLSLDQVGEALDMLHTKRGDPQRIVIEIAPE